MNPLKGILPMLVGAMTGPEEAVAPQKKVVLARGMVGETQVWVSSYNPNPQPKKPVSRKRKPKPRMETQLPPKSKINSRWYRS